MWKDKLRQMNQHGLVHQHQLTLPYQLQIELVKIVSQDHGLLDHKLFEEK